MVLLVVCVWLKWHIGHLKCEILADWQSFDYNERFDWGDICTYNVCTHQLECGIENECNTARGFCSYQQCLIDWPHLLTWNNEAWWFHLRSPPESQAQIKSMEHTNIAFAFNIHIHQNQYQPIIDSFIDNRDNHIDWWNLSACAHQITQKKEHVASSDDEKREL